MSLKQFFESVLNALQPVEIETITKQEAQEFIQDAQAWVERQKKDNSKKPFIKKRFDG